MGEWIKPLVIITTFNRRDETERMLESYADKTPLEDVVTVIVDNGSTDGTAVLVTAWALRHDKDSPFHWLASHEMSFNQGEIIVILNRENIGCPRALNLALARHRQPGQPVVKLDNDILINTPDWIHAVAQCERTFEDEFGGTVAMIGAYYDKVVSEQRKAGDSIWCCGSMAYPLSPIIGHAVWHSGKFMDKAGHFIVLRDDHKYGFEDLYLSHVASHLSWATLVWDGWKITNIQRHSALETRSEHVEAMRPLYNELAGQIKNRPSVYVDADGRPRDDGQE